jgi:hypothetical protein
MIHSRRLYTSTLCSPQIYLFMFLLYLLYRVYLFLTYSVLILVSLIIRFGKTQYDCLFYMHLQLSPVRLPLPHAIVYNCVFLYFFCLSFFPDSLSSSAQHFFLSMFICISSSPPVSLALQSTVQFIISIYICISFYLYLPTSLSPLQSTLLYNFVYLHLYESLPISTSPPVCLAPPPSFEYKLMTLIQEITI